MNIVKYIINDFGQPILFKSTILHCEIFAKNAVSAGFAIIYFDISNNKFKVKCFGEGDYLDLKNNASDYKIIQDYLNNLTLGSI